MSNKVAEIIRPDADFPRSFLPESIDLSKWGEIEPFFKRLLEKDPGSAVELEAWLLDISELYSALNEEGSRRYIAMTCATDDEQASKAYLDFVEKIEPHMSTLGNELDKRLIASPYLGELDENRYEVLIRDTRSQLEIFREENVPLKTELKKLAQEYQSIQGAMTVEFQGRERTMQQMAVFLKETDREVRRESWELTATRRLADADRLNAVFNGMLELRNKVARNAGFDNYVEYRFRELGRFDYAPADCFDFHEAVAGSVMPAYERSLARRKEALNLDRLRPWDLAVDPLGRLPLKPFSRPEELSAMASKAFHAVDPQLGQEFETMINRGLLDLDSRKGKAPGGYMSTLEEVRLPFIFMNAVGLSQDVYTLLHEGGHAFHAFAARPEAMLHYRHAPMEFSEVASMGMELIASNYLEGVYTRSESARARKEHLETILYLFPWIATIDAFQHWIYSNPGHSVEERNGFWLELLKRFGGDVDYAGCEDAQRSQWQRQLHLFEVPFYYIEYGIAQLGALQIWQNSKSDLTKAITDYKAGLALGGSRPLPELFTAAGIKFDFTEATIRPLVSAIEAEIEELSDLERE